MILYVDACARDASRTRRFADALVFVLPYEETVSVKLYDMNPQPITENDIAKRSASLKTGDFSDPIYDTANQFAAANTIVIAAPYWDLSFPAILKAYIEQVSVCGITFRYDEGGVPHGLCRADKLYYVTTSGGEIGKNNFGYEYIRAISLGLFGVRDTVCLRAVGLDIAGVDENAVLENACARLPELIRH